MKISIYIIILLLTTSNLFCQISRATGPWEIFIGQTGVGSGEQVIFKLEAVNHVWENETNDPDLWNVITDFDLAKVTLTGTSSSNPDDWSGFNWAKYNPVDSTNDFGWGLYKLQAYKPDDSTHSQVWFYLDFRDEEYPTYPDFSGDQITDIWIKYEYGGWNNSSYKIANDDDHVFDDATMDDEGGYISIWSLKETTNTICLEIITDEGDNPILQWHPDPKFDGASYYEVYRAESTTPSKPPLLTYSKIHTTSDNDTFRFEDIDIDLNETGDYIYYYVKKNSGSKSNYVNTRGLVSKKLNAESTKSESNTLLIQNHPNPFNPITNINYSIARTSHVYLRVYNSLAQEVAMLVNEVKSEGNYSVRFDASNLPSGVYFYKLETDYFSDVKKMIVAK